MTLCITAYRELRLTGLSQGGTIENPHDVPPCHIVINVNKTFAPRCDDLRDGMIYKHGGLASVVHWPNGFYNDWRNELARLAGYPATTCEHDPEGRSPYARGAWEADEGPFWELINFSNQEGMIGPSVCRKLLRDFDEGWRGERITSSPLPSFVSGYRAIHGGVRFAADGGCLEFS